MDRVGAGLIPWSLRGTVRLSGARLLKTIPPGGIITTSEFIESLRAEGPELVREFRLHDQAFEVPGTDGITVTTYAIL